MRIGIDAMGGDSPVDVRVGGTMAAREFLAEGDRIVLVGDQNRIREALGAVDGWESFVDIQHASQAIGMDEPPVESLRNRPDSSIAVMMGMHRQGELDACISAGNTGAFVAAGQMMLRRLKGVHRPGIAILTPTFHGPVAVCDVGANVACRAQHLHQYGLMSTVYVQVLCGIEAPRVGLLSVGAEEGKGNDLVRSTLELMKNDPMIRFVGPVEGRDLFGGVCDVLVCDGFVGNVVLKLMEGMAEGVIRGMLGELALSMPEQGPAIKKAAMGMMAKYDFNEYGGAPLLGVSGICIICHGASNERGIANAVRVAKESAKHGINEQITELLSQDRT